ncbi:MAG: HupE/UreJ family protein [Geobacter sp.]|nr:HupE/UreJ family protein [Geobacter sp.]
MATIELSSSLMAQMRGMKESGYSLGSSSDRELQQIATNVVQPCINNQLSISVNNKAQFIKVDRIVREHGLWKIWLSVDDIAFKNPVNPVKIDYRLLFEETDDTHINIAYMYSNDAAADSVQKVFDYSAPEGQYTFGSSSPTWEVSVKGTAPTAAGKPDSIKAGNNVTDAARKTSADATAAEKKATTPALGERLKSLPVSSKPAADAQYAAQVKQIHVGDDAVAAKNPVAGPPVEGKGTGILANTAPKISIFANMGEFLLLGIKHIFSGYDHIAFLLALIVIGLSIREVLKIITAFTIAHSITLLLAALQIVSLNSRFVEIVIALSICYVAVENLLKKEIRYRWLVTFAFGLIHGFGFASALQELIVGKSDLVVSVLSFNMGVEAGQIMIFLVMLPVLHLLRNRLGARMITVGASTAVFLVGFTWLIERVFDMKVLPI